MQKYGLPPRGSRRRLRSHEETQKLLQEGNIEFNDSTSSPTSRGSCHPAVVLLEGLRLAERPRRSRHGLKFHRQRNRRALRRIQIPLRGTSTEAKSFRSGGRGSLDNGDTSTEPAPAGPGAGEPAPEEGSAHKHGVTLRGEDGLLSARAGLPRAASSSSGRGGDLLRADTSSFFTPRTSRRCCRTRAVRDPRRARCS